MKNLRYEFPSVRTLADFKMRGDLEIFSVMEIIKVAWVAFEGGFAFF
jgi:hypothetical protein